MKLEVTFIGGVLDNERIEVNVHPAIAKKPFVVLADTDISDSDAYKVTVNEHFKGFAEGVLIQ